MIELYFKHRGYEEVKKTFSHLIEKGPSAGLYHHEGFN